MRIIAGRDRGRTLRVLPGVGTRPTAAKVREALFSMLGFSCMDARVLDLFAGSGALGLEALSRGAQSAMFVEENRGAYRVLQGNAKHCGARATLWQMAATAAVRRLEQERPARQFDLVFLDPPYHTPLLQWAVHALIAGRLLAPGATLVAEHHRQQGAPESGMAAAPDRPAPSAMPVTPIGQAMLALARQRHFGDTTLSIYTAAGADRDVDHDADANAGVDGDRPSP